MGLVTEHKKVCKKYDELYKSFVMEPTQEKGEELSILQLTITSLQDQLNENSYN